MRDSALGVEFEIDPRFARLETPTAGTPDVTRVPPGGNGDGPGGNGHGPASGGAEAAGAAVPQLPTAHFIAVDPAAGWIAALAIVTVAVEPLPPDVWLEQQLLRARASFAQWSAASHEMLVPPETAELAGRPALHVRYRLAGAEPEGAAAEDAGEAAGEPPPSLVEHWTVLVAERSWLLAMELMVQPPERWDEERASLDLPFRTLALL